VSDPAEALERSLRRLRRSVLVSLGVCAAVLAAGAARETARAAPVPPWPYLAGALALAVVSVAARGPAPASAPLTRARLHALLASFVCAAAIGGLGVGLAIAEGMWRAGLLYTVAGLLLAIRPPPRLT
jgi:hypothetical protein